MIQNITETLEIDGVTFSYPLLRKPEIMGTIDVDHWWIDARTLYAQRRRDKTTLRVIVDYFWALCRYHNTTDDRGVQESYVLARILPLTRGNAARRVVNDARIFPSRGPSAGNKKRDAADLQQLLEAAPLGRLSFHEFKEKTAEVLGPPRLTPELIERYQEFTAKLFEEACTALTSDHEGAVTMASARWMKAVKAWGRHRGFAQQKQILNILSYEARAALHRCYSAVWCELLPRLVDRHALDAFSQDFHQLWHLDRVLETDPAAPTRTHLFHGHVFALHPASSLMLCTTAGRNRVGAWLAAGTDRDAEFERLLHAVFLAIHHYAGIHAAVADDRRAMPPTSDSPPA